MPPRQEPAAAEPENEVLGRILRGVWPSLPALLCASATLCAAGAVAVFAAPGITPVSLLLLAVLVGPFAAALAGTVNEIAFDGETTIRAWWSGLRGLWLFGLRQALLPAVPWAVFLVALSAWTQTENPFVLPSLAVSGACGVCALLGLLATLPLGAARPGLRGRVLWLSGLHLVARLPLRFLAAPCLAALGVWSATSWSASMLLLVPAPVAVVTVAATWTSIAHVGVPLRASMPDAAGGRAS